MNNKQYHYLNYDYCILSSCNFAAIGLKQLFHSLNLTAKIIQVNENVNIINSLVIKNNIANGVYIVFLPEDPFFFLLTLREVAYIFNASKFAPKIIILSNVSSLWIWNTLRLQVSDESLLNNTQIIKSFSSIEKLSTFFIELINFNSFPQENRLNKNTLLIEKNDGLTPREIESLIDLFRDGRGFEINKNKDVSPKTLCTQMNNGIKKMIGSAPELTKRLPGANKRWKTKSPILMLSKFEREFMDCIENKNVFPVFQPIVDCNKKIEGFEILTRWDMDGKIISAGEFIPHFKSHHAILSITIFTLREAIDGINRYNGKYYFAINIHPVMAINKYLIEITKDACRKLKNKKWKEKLVFEYSEEIIYYRCDLIYDIFHQLKNIGIKIFLDDCYSRGSSFFPVRRIPFCGFKLDKNIVNNIGNNQSDDYLIRAIAYYCNISGNTCIAEGVERDSTVDQLINMGVKSFQGYFFSHPVCRSDINQLISNFNAPNMQ